jgi:hypothetical protein
MSAGWFERGISELQILDVDFVPNFDLAEAPQALDVVLVGLTLIRDITR